MLVCARSGSQDGNRAAMQRRRPRRSADAVYWVQLAGYAAYSALIAYLVIDRAERGALALGVYAFAMAVHFLIVDHALAEEHGRMYTPRGRWLLAASVLVGWLIGAATPVSKLVVARLFAILAGGKIRADNVAELVSNTGVSEVHSRYLDEGSMRDLVSRAG